MVMNYNDGIFFKNIESYFREIGSF